MATSQISQCLAEPNFANCDTNFSDSVGFTTHHFNPRLKPQYVVLIVTAYKKQLDWQLLLFPNQHREQTSSDKMSKLQNSAFFDARSSTIVQTAHHQQHVHEIRTLL